MSVERSKSAFRARVTVSAGNTPAEAVPIFEHTMQLAREPGSGLQISFLPVKPPQTMISHRHFHPRRTPFVTAKMKIEDLPPDRFVDRD
jgi:hypothetical protein